MIVKVRARSERRISSNDTKRYQCNTWGPPVIPDPIKSYPRSKRKYKRPVGEQWNHSLQF
jgi:hypothetical protein